MSVAPGVFNTATFSPCRKYRYTLWRRWADGPYLMVIGLNPSTADEMRDDPTIRRCIGFAKYWGYHGLCMTNLFGYRATDPADMKACPEPIGEGNNQAIRECAKDAGFVLAAWGAHGSHLYRNESIVDLVQREIHCLGLTKEGHPRHPLYVRADQQPVIYRSRGLGYGQA